GLPPVARSRAGVRGGGAAMRSSNGQSSGILSLRVCDSAQNPGESTEAPMPSPSMVLVSLAAALALISLGGGFYEFSVVDPFWPERPDIIQPTRGGISRKRF